jgi:glycosyltransferase involved in cell wall biosynthesis
MTQPQFTVVIPLYNKAQSIGRTLDSVCAQTFQDLEVIIIDDGSTDDSVNVVTPRLNDRIRLISQSNGGVSAARNAGLRAARSSYVAFLDADDLWLPEYLETLANLIRLYPNAGIYATAYRLSDGQILRTPGVDSSVTSHPAGPISDYFRAAALGEPPFFTSSTCVNRDIALALGGFKIGIRHGEDLDMWARIALHNEIVFTPEAKAVYRIDAENRTAGCMPVLKPWSFRDDFLKERIKDTLSLDEVKYIQEYCARVELYYARGNLLNPDRQSLRRYIQGIETSLFSNRKRLYRIYSYVPPVCMQLLFLLHRKLRGN